MSSKNSILIQSKRPHQKLKFMYTNIRSLNNKLSEFKVFVELEKPSILVLNETWLSPDVSTNILCLPNYTVYRKDRKTRGGGVLIAILFEFNSNEVETVSECELLTVDLLPNTLNCIRIITGYNPSCHDVLNLKEICLQLEKLTHKTQHYVIIGDLNLPNFDWNKHYMNATKPNVILQRFLDLSFPIFQIIHTPTRNEAILDIILTNSLETVRDINDHPQLGLLIIR